MRGLFLALIYVSFFSSLAAHSQSLPKRTLKKQHNDFIGKWIHLKSYCENWSDEQINLRHDKLKAHWFVGHLFINGWDAKFVDSTLRPSSTKKPYEFCVTSTLFKPYSQGKRVYFSFVENGGDSDCEQPIPQVFNDKMTMAYRIKNGPNGYADRLFGWIDNTNYCGGKRLYIIYKRR